MNTPKPTRAPVFTEAVEMFRCQRALLQTLKDKRFKAGTPVLVCCDQYDGYGIVSRCDGTPPDKLDVRLANGNVWTYPIEECWPVRWLTVDAATRRYYLNFRGYKLLTGSPRRPLP